MIRKFLALVLLFSYSSTIAIAAPAKPVKVVAAKALLTSSLSGSSADEIVGIIHTTQGFIFSGTVESNTASPLLSAAGLGKSDGFISAVGYAGSRIFDLRLGTSADDVATGVTRDKSGIYWVVGATSNPISRVDTAVAVPAINPDNAAVESITVPTGLNRLLVWKISATGSLLSTYTYDPVQEIYPQEISQGTSGFTITGLLADATSFSINMDAAGAFSAIAPVTIKKVVQPELVVIKAGTNTYKSFISKTTIIGIPTWKAKSPTPVVVQYNKANTLKAAYSLKGTVIYQKWQSSIGLVVVTQTTGSYSLYVLPLVA